MASRETIEREEANVARFMSHDEVQGRLGIFLGSAEKRRRSYNRNWYKVGRAVGDNVYGHATKITQAKIA